MNHGSCPQAEFDLFLNIFGFKLVTFAYNCFLENIPLVTPRPGLKTLGWHWIVLVNCICTSCGRPAPETRILHIGFQSSFTRESQFQFLPKRGGCEPLTTRSGTMPLWFCDFGTWIGQGTDQKLGHSALFWFVGGYWRVEVESPWNACCKSPGI